MTQQTKQLLMTQNKPYREREKFMKKSKNLLKTIGTMCLSGISLAGICVGGMAFADYAGTGFTGLKTQAEQTEQTQNDVMAVSYDFKGMVNKGQFIVEYYTGNQKQFIVPATVSLGPVVDKEYTFKDDMELSDYLMELTESLSQSYSDWSATFEKTYSFVCADNTIITASSLEEIQKVQSSVGAEAYPVKHIGPCQTYVEGNDYVVYFHLRDEAYESLTEIGVEKIKFQAGIGGLLPLELAKRDIIVEFDEADEQFGTIKYDDRGYLVNNGTELMSVYSKAYVDNFVVPNEFTKIGESCFRFSTKISSIDLNNVTEIGYSAFTGCKNLTSIDLTNITSLAIGSFGYCEKLAQVTLPKSLTKIPDGCFSSTAISSIDLSNITEIGQSAFTGCKNLTSIDLTNTTYIDDWAFRDCVNLSNLTSSAKVETIGRDAFNNTAITSIVLPNIIEICGSAFKKTSDLPQIKLIDFGSKLTTITNYGYFNAGAKNIETMIFRSETPPVFKNGASTKYSFNYVDAIYVIDSAYETYLADSAFSSFSSKIKKLSEYTG